MYKSILTVVVLVTVPMITAAADLKGDPAAGQSKSAICTACHGEAGNSVNPEWPKIAGQGTRYIIAQLKAFKQGPAGPRHSQNSALMYGIAAGLSEQDMADLAAYYSQQQTSPGVADDELAKKGEAIYRGGEARLDAAACIGCHGPSGKGNAPAGFPAIGGQHAQYTYNQLQAFHQALRTGDVNMAMQHMVRNMSEDEMRAVAEYVQGLH